MISFIIVNYESVKELKKCLKDLAELRDANKCEVIIVNNDEKPLSLPQYNFKQQLHLEINKNVGYSAANNHGLLHASEPYICFLNPDTYKFSENFLDIISFIDENTLVSPQIRTEESRVQEWSSGERITLFQIIKNNLGIHKKLWLETEVSSVHWVSGAALCAPKKLLKELGGFDEDYFLYFEDVDLCQRHQDRGGDVLYVPYIHLTHSCGKSSKKTRKNQKKWYYESQDTFFKKHLGALQAFLLRALRLLHIK